MTTGPAQGPPSNRDLDAIRKIQDYVQQELPYTRARADKWVTALTTITGVLTTVMLIKGPDTFSAISEHNVWWIFDPRLIVVALLTLGGVALVIGLYHGYSAATGSPIFGDKITALVADPAQRGHGAAEKWIHAVVDTTRHARRSLATAIIVTLVGMVCLVAAVLYAAYAPADEQRNCATVHLQGQLADTVGGTIVFGPCSTKP